MALDAEFNQIPLRLEQIQKEKMAHEESLSKWSKDELAKLQKHLGEIREELESIDNQKETLTAQREKELSTIQSSFKKQKKELKDNCLTSKRQHSRLIRHTTDKLRLGK